MSRTKFLITLAVIGGIHQFYGDEDTDTAKMHIPAATCAGYSVNSIEVERLSGSDTDAFGAQDRLCTDATTRPAAANG